MYEHIFPKYLKFHRKLFRELKKIMLTKVNSVSTVGQRSREKPEGPKSASRPQNISRKE